MKGRGSMLKADLSDTSGAAPLSGLRDRFEFAQAVARDAGGTALNYFSTRQDLVVESKGLHDRVTVADRAVEQEIREALAARFPEDGFLGEEATAARASVPQGSDIWVVDPIDGTDCFVFGMPSWCVSIACVRDGVVQLGAIFDPVHDELFAAARGHGAFLNGQALRLTELDSVNTGLVGIGHSTRIAPATSLAAMTRLVESGGMYHRCGSGALSLAWIASGRLVGYYEAHMNAWDCLAGLVLIEEAGGWTNGFPVRDGLLTGGEVIAAAPGLADAMKYVAGLDGAGNSEQS